ncbi:hypothetical protein GGU11DRAFT_440275 [Lentinula aff. detonsa]|nr:hypothetical protein GGU11DRAFT_440275 [Lentinula aff. detonsa]
MDNLSEVSDITHNPSQSSRGSSPQPLANDATLKYVVDIIKANEEKDQQMRDEIKRLQERATKAKKLLEEQYYLLNAEREHRDRIMTFLLYNVRNNNRWIGQSVNADQLEAAVLKEMVSNGGRGWRDMGEWEYGEVWSGPMVVSESNIEITASNLDEYLRDMWDIHQRARMEGNTAENEDDTRSADPPSAPDILSNTPADYIDTSAPLSRKRKISCPPLSEHEDQPTEKRPRLSPIVEDSLTVNPTHPSPPSIVRKNKGKGRMTSLEVEQLQRQQAREKRVRSMKELDEDDSADTYEIQVALADSLLQSAGETAMDQ